MTSEGERHFALGEFGVGLPNDVGGAGSFTNLATSLGSAGIYVERFRGNDDLYGQMQKRLAAADQLTDMVLGWSSVEFGRERNYSRLRSFLDVEFRRDLRNFATYVWVLGMASTDKPESGKGFNFPSEEFTIRFTQHLLERGYAKVEDQSALAEILLGRGEAQALRLTEKLVAEKLGVSGSDSRPKRFGLFADATAVAKSWEGYLGGTKLYRAKLRQWEQERKRSPNMQRPEPSAAGDDIFATLLEPGSGGGSDQITVKITLPSRPDHTNGKWDGVRRQVVWESGLEEKGRALRLPVFCYASWSSPEEEFQREHFGRVILRGDELLAYCIWRGTLTAGQGQEWETFLGELKPEGELEKRLDAFHFATTTDASGKELIKAALAKKS